MKRVVGRELLTTILKEAAPADLRIVGRMLFHAAIVGVAAGLVGAAFFAALEVVQRLILEDLGGYRPLRAHGETFLPELSDLRHFRPWLLLLVPAVGALASGIISELAPETRGGGGDAMINAFHRQDGVVRRRVAWVKALASIFTLGTGGSGGREGPTMQIGGALGSTCGWLLRVDARERRILMVSGVAAGISAVFRTPLGAALLAVEVLYRDDFESDALIPAVLASVVAYSVVISIFGETTLFANPGHFPFITKHLPLYALLALMVSALAVMFLSSLRTVQRVTASLPIPRWARPGLGGLALGVFCVPIILFVGWRVAQPGQGLGLLGGGYGAVQIAITGSDWLPIGWAGVGLLAGLCLAKIIASSLTIGSGGSAGDFAPVAGDRRAVRRRVRPRGADAAPRPAHRPGRVRAGRDGDVLRRHRARAAVVAGAGVRAGGQLRPAGAADARRGHRVRRAAPPLALPRAAARRSATHPPTSTRRSTSCARRASAR